MYYLGDWRAGSVFKSTILSDNLGSDISNHMEATSKQQSTTPLPGNLSPPWLLHAHGAHAYTYSGKDTDTYSNQILNKIKFLFAYVEGYVHVSAGTPKAEVVSCSTRVLGTELSSARAVSIFNMPSTTELFSQQPF